eukprot:7391491-Prymnesium_polylepis.3
MKTHAELLSRRPLGWRLAEDHLAVLVLDPAPPRELHRVEFARLGTRSAQQQRVEVVAHVSDRQLCGRCGIAAEASAHPCAQRAAFIGVSDLHRVDENLRTGAEALLCSAAPQARLTV